MHRIILREPKNVEYAIKSIQAVKVDPDKPFEVVIREYKRNRSLEQNNLYWKWLEIIGNTLGYSKDDMHEAMMRLHLTPRIVEVNGETIEAYSTRTLKVREMSDYMTKIQAWAAEFGIALPVMEE